MKGIIFLIFILFQISWSVKTLPFTVLAEYPHNSKAFTQGLYYDGQYMYEGTGLYRETYLRKQTLETGTVLQVDWIELNERNTEFQMTQFLEKESQSSRTRYSNSLGRIRLYISTIQRALLEVLRRHSKSTLKVGDSHTMILTLF
eukprot:TRINITY_DN4034_c0_g1_i2.p1 TRINITY_DN4034_c0_g1~~TRINITY_DN4034_c0_g1_i2.p1  ORF type:complete len:145 (+),score=11.63 TRINITY_DN4034_c0_g1_i2:51-485(+)